MIWSLSTTKTGLKDSRLPVFSAWNSMKPNRSRSFISSLTDLKSLPRSFARAYIDFGFLVLRV